MKLGLQPWGVWATIARCVVTCWVSVPLPRSAECGILTVAGVAPSVCPQEGNSVSILRQQQETVDKAWVASCVLHTQLSNQSNKGCSLEIAELTPGGMIPGWGVHL